MKLCAFWHGPNLSWLEAVCLTSAVSVGHQVDLYTYGDINSVPDGVNIKDASDVMPLSLMISSKRSKSTKRNSGVITSKNMVSFAHGADIFRMHSQKQARGCYIDCDMLLLKPIAEEEYIFGFEQGSWINNAVLRLPPSSPMISDFLASISRKPVLLSWWSRGERWKQYWRWLRGRDRKLEDIPLTWLGPKAISGLCNRHSLAHLAKPSDVFYPVEWMDAADPFIPGKLLPITERTVGVHLWSSAVKPVRYMTPTEGSFIGDHCKRLGIMASHWQVAPATLAA